MRQKNGGSKKLLAFLLSFVMIFSSLGAFNLPVNAAGPSAETEGYSSDETVNEIIEIPIVNEKGNKGQRQEKSDKLSVQSEVRALTVTESVYEGYALTGWDSINCDLSVTDFVYGGEYDTYIEEAPIPLYTGADFASIYDPAMTFKIELKDTADGATLYEVYNADIERIEQSGEIGLLGVAYGIEPGTYDVYLTAQLGENTYNFQTIRQTYYSEMINGGKLYAPIKATDFWANIDDIGSIPVSVQDTLSFEVQDASGNVVAKSSQQLEYVEYGSNGDWYIDGFERWFETNYMAGTVFKTGVVEAGKEYSLKLYADNGSGKTEIVLPTQLKVEFTDNPVIKYMNLYGGYNDPLVESDTSFRISAGFFNLKNKDSLTFDMLDSQGDVIASSSDSNYDYIDELERDSRIVYTMELLSGKSLINGEEYSLRVTSTETGLINSADAVRLRTTEKPRIMSVDYTEAAQGRFIIDALNLNEGEEYKISLNYSALDPYIYSAFEAPTPDIGNSIDAEYGSYEATAVYNTDRQLEVQFTSGGQPIPFGEGHYSIIVRNITGEEFLCSTSFSIGNRYKDIYIYYPHNVKANATSYEFGMEFYNVSAARDNIKIELVDDGGTAVAEADYASLTFEEEEYFEDYGYSDKYIYIEGSMKLKEGFIPEVGVEYIYRVTIDGKEFSEHYIFENSVTFVDGVAAEAIYVREAVNTRLFGENPLHGEFISTQEELLNIHIENVVNLNEQNKDKLAVELYRTEYNIETGEHIEKEMVGECNPADILADSTYTTIDAVMNIDTPLPEGEYLIALKHNGNSISKRLLKFTSRPGADEVYKSDILAAPGDKLSYEFYNAINLDPEQISANIYNIDGQKIASANHASTQILDPDYKYDFGVELQIPAAEALEEGCYIAHPVHNEKELTFGYYRDEDNLLRVTSLPVLTSSGYHIENGKVVYYYIHGLNLDAAKDYKAYFYFAGGESDIADFTLTKEMNLGTIDSDKGAFIISSDSLTGIPNGRYQVVVESEDGTVIGDTSLWIRDNATIPPTNADPKVSINSGAAYTNSTSVKLGITAVGYTEVKIAESEAGLAAAEYKAFTDVMSYTLSTDDGKKTLFFKFRTYNGTESKVIAQSIYLDTLVPAVPSSFGLMDGTGKILADGIIAEDDYIQLFAVGAEKYIKSYARVTGTGIDETIRLGYMNQNAEDKSIYAARLKFSDYYSSADKITFFFEDYAGNKSAPVEKSISVRELASITGTLYKGSSADGETVGYQSVLLQKKAGEEYIDYKWAYADQYGAYSFDNVPNGEYRLFSYAPWGYIDYSETLTVADYADLVQPIEFAYKYSATGSLVVNVKDSEGNSVDGAYVYLSNWEIGKYYYLNTTGGAADFTDIVTATAGVKYYLYVYYNGCYKSEEITIKGGSNVSKEIVLPSMGVIKGTVIDKDSKPISDIDVYAVGTNGEYIGARTNAEGKYELIAPKEEATAYKVYVYDNMLSMTADRIWSDIVPDNGETDFVLYSKPDVFGIVKGSDGKNIETTVYATGIDPYNWSSVRSDADGDFRFDGLLGLGKYKVGAYGIAGYYSAEKEFEITKEDLEAGTAKDFGTITLDSYGREIFNSSFNNVRTDVSYIQKGKNVTVRVNYHNTKNISLNNVTIKAYIPDGVTLVPGSGALAKRIDRLKAGEKGELTFTVKVEDSFSANRVTIKAVGVYNGSEQAIGYADVEVVSATINAPEEMAASKPFKVYGEATADSEVSIIARNNATGNEEILAITKPSGRWYYADISTGLAEGEYKLFAKVTKGNETGFSDYADISVKADALYIEDIVVVSPNGQSLGANEETGIAAFSTWVTPQLQGSPIGACVQFDKGDVAGHFEFFDVEYPAAYENGYMKTVIEKWSGYGTQKLYYVTGTGKRFIIAEITILIDPSGYVYDRFTNERIQGAVVTCEIKNNDGSWIKWDAEKYGQVNPQVTDYEGKYGWMVPDGEYRIKVQKDGYEAYVTTSDGDSKLESIIIPPPRMDVNIGLTNIENPMVNYTIPEDGKTAGVNAQIAVVFTKPMDSSLSTLKFEVTDDLGNKVPGNISFTDNDTRVVFAPTQPLEHGKIYNVLLTGFTDKKDRSGTARSLGDYGFSFTVSQEVQTVYLKNTAIVPANGAANVETTAAVAITFDKDLDASSINENTIKLLTQSGEKVKAELKTDKNTVALTPENALMTSTIYRLIIESDVKSSDGYYLEKDITSSFTTKADQTDNHGTTHDSDRNGDSGSTVTSTPTTVDPLSIKVDEAIKKGAKEVIVTADKNGNAELLKADLDKLINKNMSLVIQNGNIKAVIDLADLKSTLSTASKVTFTIKEKAADALPSGYNKLSSILELKIYADSKEIKTGKKVDVRFEGEALLKGISSNLKAGVYKKTGSTLEYIPGSHVSKKGIVSFKLDSFGEFIIAEYSKKFADMDKYKWASDFVEIMAARQITTGTGDNRFSPEKAVTRAEFAVFITKALGIEIQNARNTFNDVEAGKWYTNGIVAAAAAGIVKGDGKGSFNPQDTINREQMAVMIMRAYEYMTGNSKRGNATFEDMSEVSSYAQSAVLGAKELGILDGVGSNKFMPKDTSIRAAAAKMIVKLLELVKE